ncbi:hypothetical protein BKA65DRAFT_556563 [Rhexocercosporidium sp. MPI-PUGE-AT-0058]|nr:hypothetical protein BKA65DRAFT_556563 [Rhexocercosporidium sp. MPI-PUGE-AT-0058]
MDFLVPDSGSGNEALEDGALENPWLTAEETSQRGTFRTVIRGPDRFLCNICDYTLCPDCWPKPLQHRQKPRKDQLKHEKTDPALIRKIDDALHPDQDPQQYAELHINDRDTTWFGLGTGNYFVESDRFMALMTECTYGKPSALSPSLVSFVGQTGAGKSSLINLLISLSQNEGESFEKPIVSLERQSNVPTSGDVHLYQDPRTVRDQNPLLFADCEGLNGGEGAPASSVACASQERHKHVESDHSIGTWAIAARSGATAAKSIPPAILKYVGGKLRELLWLKPDKKKSKSSEAMNRQYIVEEFYSRILYTFSDVVVFVLQETRTVENVVILLLDWASKSIEKSSNQACLPHGILVLNMAPVDLDEADWDSQKSTQWLFQELDKQINNNSRFHKYMKPDPKHPDRMPKTTTEELLQLYYSTIKVIRMPEFRKGSRQPRLIEAQVRSLSDQILHNCEAVRDRKLKARTLLNAEQFGPYLKLAFDHFAGIEGLNKPFDFVQASFLSSTVQPDFSSNLFGIAFTLLSRRVSERDTLSWLSKLVASCIMFEASRQSRPGREDQILAEYSPQIDSALGKVVNEYWPCQAQVNGEPCINFLGGHTKGHQNEAGTFQPGPFEASGHIDPTVWIKDFQDRTCQHLSKLFDEITRRRRNSASLTELKLATESHRKTLGEFFQKCSDHYSAQKPMDLANKERLSEAFKPSIRSNSACLSCLVGQANHSLTCGHVLCDSCIASFGMFTDDTSSMISQCPLDLVKLRPTTTVVRKPPLAGVRVLCLDGGGVRGIMQLTYLKYIEAELGGSIPIQSFFDLAIGTSIGGIVVLGLFSNGWTVTECTAEFKSLCKEAFPGSWWHMPVLESIGSTFVSRYPADKLEAALKKAFTQDARMLGHPCSRQVATQSNTKIAVTSSVFSSGQGCIFTNYNRLELPHADRPPYSFIREQIAEKGIRVWEAARASSAAPTWFDEFYHANSGQNFLDGGLYNNNPINIAFWEQRLIWPNCQSDIIVSLGCGQASKKDNEPASSNNTNTRFAAVKRFAQSWTEWIVEKVPGRAIYGVAKIAWAQFENSMDSQKTWAEFYNKLDYGKQQRAFRLSAMLQDKVPELDDVESIPMLEQCVTDSMSTNFLQQQLVRQLARRLVASSFYFDLKDKKLLKEEQHAVKGSIHCRFPKASLHEEIRHLGKYFKSIYEDNAIEAPYFLVKEEGRIYEHMFHLTDPILENMITNSNFSLSSQPFVVELRAQSSLLHILLCFGQNQDDQFPISGFPRAFRSSDD